MKKKTLILVALIVLAIAFLIWRSLRNDRDSVLAGKTDVTVQLQWFDGAQFGGLYVALDKGYFLDEGLRVNLKPLNSFTSDPIALLTDGNSDIAIASADQVLINKDKGKEIKVFGTVFNRSLACYMYKKEKNVDSLTVKDLEGKKIGVFKKFDTENILLSLIKKNNLSINPSNIVQAGGIDEFIHNEVDIYGSYLINEPIEMRLAGNKIGIIDPAQYGVQFYSDTYITKTDFWNNKKELVERFLRAANKGWEYAKQHPEETIDIMFKLIKNKTKDQYYAKELASLKEAIKYVGDGSEKHPAFMRKEVWENIEKDLFDIKRISQTGYIDDLCDFNIINKIYER